MATKPYTPKPPRVSTGFNLDSITEGVAGLFNQFNTVQVKNGSQSVILQRADDSANSAQPPLQLQTSAGGTLSFASQSKAVSDAKAALSLKKSKGFWANLPTGAKIGIVAGGALLLVGGGVFLYLK